MGGSQALSWAETDRIIDQEVRRFRGTLPGYDTDDLKQECRMAVAMRLKADQIGARSYVRVTAQNRLSNLLRTATTQRACPHDSFGRPQRFEPSIEDLRPAAADDPERTTAQRETLAYLAQRLDQRDWQKLLQLCVHGAQAMREQDRLRLASIRSTALAIIQQLDYRVSQETKETPQMPTLPVTAQEDLMECHADGKEPQGYDPGEATCQQCPDKFTCLPRSIEKGLVKLKLSADREVEAVLSDRITFDDAIARMKRRNALVHAKKKPADDELSTWVGLMEDIEEIEDETENEEDIEDENLETEAEDEAEDKNDKRAEEGQEAGTKEGDDTVGTKDKAKPKKKAAAKKVAPKKEPQVAAKKAEAKPPKVKPVKPAKKVKPKAAPRVHAPSSKGKRESVSADVDKSGVISVAGVQIGRVKKTADGFGWFSLDGSRESPEWYEDQATAIKKAVKALFKNGKPPEPAKPKSWPTMANGKPLPTPAPLSEEEMKDALSAAQSKLGANIELDYGMRLVRRKRQGEIVCYIRPNGFEYTIDEKDAKAAGLDSTKQLFGSLSSVAMWVEKRMVSGLDFFNISKHNCTEIRSSKGQIIDRKGGVELEK